MAFLICLIDIILLVIHSLNTLGLVHQIRKTNSCKDVDFLAVCFTWILYFAFHPFTTCTCEGFFASFFRLIGILGKIYVVIPLLGGALKLYDIFVEKGKAKQIFDKLTNTVQNLVAPKPADQSKAETIQETQTTTPS